MASHNLTQRTRDDPTTTATKNNPNPINRPRRDKKMAMAKRGLKSLAVSIAIPASLTVSVVYLAGAARFYRAQQKPIWLPPLWALWLAQLGSALLMGLAAWLVWAEGGFHRDAKALYAYLGQMGLGLLWDPIVLGAGAVRVGLVVSGAVFGALVGCSRIFKGVNPIAGDLVKPCLAWAAFLVIVNLKLLYV